MEPGVVMILAGIGALIIGAISLTRWFEKQRRDAWRQAAEELGILFAGERNDVVSRCEDPAFSKAFVLQGEDEAAIRGLFDDRVHAWFVRQKGSSFCFEAWGNRLVFHRGRHEKPREARRLLQEALEIMKRLAAK
ncbi:MAG: hypothetical protein PHO07_06210 [Pirellulales bacterium]|nr:hypothetical protein [Thermoguttaceae bacterium]MDD4786753.1 hypothetical protein [Pirellulales bacterium]MDI9444295.1 hypothetical protein [Planctomycetota bacterium]NLY99865.1 hypothetical protein [Pirellulaceae bacterium]